MDIMHFRLVWLYLSVIKIRVLRKYSRQHGALLDAENQPTGP